MPRSIRGVCPCGAPVRSKGRTEYGLKLWDRVCWRCRENGYRSHKKNYCEMCGFIAVHQVQLDVDHIDGNHANGDPSNLMTLCANCHRLKTQRNSDHMPVRQASVFSNAQLVMFDE
jgi:5-methylcytosine-specific restriction endonuclease McrA